MSNIKEYFQSNKYGKYLYNNIFNIDTFHLNKNLITYLRYLITTMISIVIFRSATIVDTIFTGQFISTTGLAAIALIAPIDLFCVAVNQCLTSGSLVVIGDYLGQRNYGKADALYTKTCITVLVISLFLSLILFIFAKPLIFALGGNEEILKDSLIYLRIYAIFLTFRSFEHVLSAFVRLVGRTSIPPMFSFINTIINFSLKYIFVIKMNMGMYGIILSTSLALFIVSLMYLYCLLSDKEKRLNFTMLMGSFKEILYIAYNGISSFAMLISTAVFTIFMNKMVTLYLGNDGLAALAPISMIAYINDTIIAVFTTSMVPLISISYGQRYFHNVKLFLQYALIGSLIFGGLFFILSSVSPSTIVNLFLDKNITSENVVKLAIFGLSLVKYEFIAVIFTVVLNEFLTAIQRPAESLILSILSAIAIPVPFMLVMSKLFGSWGLFSSFSIAGIISATITILVVYFGRKKYLSYHGVAKMRF